METIKAKEIEKSLVEHRYIVIYREKYKDSEWLDVWYIWDGISGLKTNKEQAIKVFKDNYKKGDYVEEYEYKLIEIPLSI